MSINPYAPPLSESPLQSRSSAEFEQVRKEHLNCEIGIRTVSLFYFLASCASFAAASLFLTRGGDISPLARMVLVLALGGMAVLQFWVGSGMRSLKPRVRVPAGFIALMSLVGSAAGGGPMLVIVYIYILCLVFSEKGKMVFSPQYQEVLAATPHIKGSPSPVILVFLVLLALAFFALVVFPMVRDF